MNLPLVFVVVLNWNGCQDTLECLASLSQATYPNMKTVVVDNGSTDGSPERVRTAYPDVQIILNDTNLGYADGNNIGIRYALAQEADYVLLLNNDTVVHPEFLRNLIEVALDHPGVGVFGPIIYFFDEPERLWYAGGKWIPDMGYFIHHRYGEIDDKLQNEPPFITDFVTGCALLTSSVVLREVGLLESKFFLTFEDTDWCSRVQRTGYTCLIVPNAKVWHKVSRSFKGEESAMRSYFMMRNWLLWLERNIPLSQKPAIYRRVLVKMYWEFLGVRSSTFKRRMKQRWAMALGIRDYAARRFGNCPHSVRVLDR